MRLENLCCIDLDQPSLSGFRKFISCWLYHSEDLSFVVDPGPLSTIPHLLDQLQRHQVDKLDYILLTHIHIDHAGGTGQLLRHYPQARVICHPQGMKHLVEPEKLWQGSKKVLGKFADAYGEIVPVPQNNLMFAEAIENSGIRCHKTPGHAQHHCCYQFSDLLFGGEVAGVHMPLAEGIYMRPATPPKFILEVALDSIQRMLELQPRYLVIAHYGLVEPAVDYLKIGAEQLKLWVKAVALNGGTRNDETKQKTVEWLLSNDLIYKNISKLEDDIKNRESHFLDNSLRGMTEYVESLPEEEKNLLSQPD